MTQTIRAVYENGVLRPLDPITLQERVEVRVTVESAAWGEGSAPEDDPLAGLSVRTGIRDLAENIDDYRFGRRTP